MQLGSPFADDLRHRVEQTLGVRVLRAGEQRVDRRLLDDLPGVHDDDPVADLGDDAEVVGHEEHGHAEVALERAEQVEDLRLDRDVERGRRLVGDRAASGRCDSAIAIIARWRMPPENACG